MSTRRPGTGAIPLDDVRTVATQAPVSLPAATPVAASRRPGTGAIALDEMLKAAMAPGAGADDDAGWDVSAPTDAIPLPDDGQQAAPEDGATVVSARPPGSFDWDDGAATEAIPLPEGSVDDDVR